MLNDLSHGKIADYPKLILNADGGCEPKNPGGVATAGWVIYDPKKLSTPLVEEGRVVQDGGKLATNNFGEYSALCLGLKWLTENKWRGELTVKADSKLLVEQINGRWKCKAPHLAVLRDKAWGYMEELKLHLVSPDEPLPEEGKTACSVIWIRRELNKRPDELCHLAYEEYVAGGKLKE